MEKRYFSKCHEHSSIWQHCKKMSCTERLFSSLLLRVFFGLLFSIKDSSYNLYQENFCSYFLTAAALKSSLLLEYVDTFFCDKWAMTQKHQKLIKKSTIYFILLETIHFFHSFIFVSWCVFVSDFFPSAMKISSSTKSDSVILLSPWLE